MHRAPPDSEYAALFQAPMGGAVSRTPFQGRPFHVTMTRREGIFVIPKSSNAAHAAENGGPVIFG